MRPENVYLTGSVDSLKDWSPDNAILMDPADYPIWSGMPQITRLCTPSLT